MDCSLKNSDIGRDATSSSNLRIDPTRLACEPSADDSHLGLVDIAIFYFDRTGR